MSKTLEQIEVGDRVWVRTGQYGRKLRRVERLTPKQIILNGLIEYSRFERGKPPRYALHDPEPTYNRIGRGSDWERIVAVATPEEIALWEAEQEKKTAEAAARQREQDAQKAKRAELNGLFGSERVWVRESGHNTAGEWILNVYASEDEVRRLAEALRGVIV